MVPIASVAFCADDRVSIVNYISRFYDSNTCLHVALFPLVLPYHEVSAEHKTRCLLASTNINTS